MLLTKKYMLKIFLFIFISMPAEVYAVEWKIRTSPTEYHPAKLEVNIGDKITWINDDMVVHEMAFSSNPTGSDDKNLYLFLPVGKTLSIIVTKHGTYLYKCSWHGMFGIIKVRPAN